MEEYGRGEISGAVSLDISLLRRLERCLVLSCEKRRRRGENMGKKEVPIKVGEIGGGKEEEEKEQKSHLRRFFPLPLLVLVWL